MRHIGESRTYVVPELSTDNEQWINPDFGSPDLRMHYDNIRQMVKEKTGRAMQEKERERKGKNGKIVKIAGCSPIREGLVEEGGGLGVLAACQVGHHTGRRA